MVYRAVALDMPQQLDLPLQPPRMQPPSSVAWIVSLCRSEFGTALRWLSDSSRSQPFFIDAQSGSAIVASDQIVVLIDNARSADHIYVPRHFGKVDADRLLKEIVVSGKPHSLLGLTPRIYDGLLMRRTGGALRYSPRQDVRTPFETMIERISTRKFRENSVAVNRICSRAIGSYDIAGDLSHLLQRVWAEAIAQGSMEKHRDGRDALDNVLRTASQFHSRKLHHVGAQLEALMKRNSWLSEERQLSLFDSGPDQTIDIPNTAIRHLSCSLIPVAYETETVPLHSDALASRRRDDQVVRSRPIPRGVLKSWLREATPGSLKPEVRIGRDSDGRTLEIEIKLIPSFLHSLGSTTLGSWKGRPARGVWDLTPVLEGRAVVPHSRRVALGESAVFRTEAVSRKNRRPLSLILLTPEHESYNIQLPDVA